jgi:hypothetical protein
MDESVKAGPHEMYSVDLPLAVQLLELNDKFEYCLVCGTETLARYFILMKNTYCKHELAVVLPIVLWQNFIEQTGAQTEYIQKKLPCFVPAVYFLSWVVRGSIKGAR